MLRLSICEYSFCSIDAGPFDAEQIIDISSDLLNIRYHECARTRYIYMASCLINNSTNTRSGLLC